MKCNYSFRKALNFSHSLKVWTVLLLFPGIQEQILGTATASQHYDNLPRTSFADVYVLQTFTEHLYQMLSKISPHPTLGVSSESSVIWAGYLCSLLIQHTEAGSQESCLSSLCELLPAGGKKKKCSKLPLFSPSSPKATWILADVYPAQ